MYGSCLNIACIKRNYGIIYRLLSNNADPNIKDGENKTSLFQILNTYKK